jgi:PTH1 family peptidyl-tRNA hydrolase
MAAQQVVIVGLGNPGIKYARTRHNIGYLVVKALSKRWGIQLQNETRFSGHVAKGFRGELVVHLLLPTTYMNRSGIAVQQYLHYYKLGPQDLIVVTDDVALAFGELRVREQGTSGGHNGLKSVEAALGTKEYKRVKMGVGSPLDHPEGAQILADYVLAPFTPEETASLTRFIDEGVEVVERLLEEPVAKVMNAINKKQQEQGKLGEEKNEP